jgi:hypothetical protein
MVTTSNGKFLEHKANGLVKDVFNSQSLLDKLEGAAALDMVLLVRFWRSGFFFKAGVAAGTTRAGAREGLGILRSGGLERRVPNFLHLCVLARAAGLRGPSSSVLAPCALYHHAQGQGVSALPLCGPQLHETYRKLGATLRKLRTRRGAMETVGRHALPPCRPGRHRARAVPHRWVLLGPGGPALLCQLPPGHLPHPQRQPD